MPPFCAVHFSTSFLYYSLTSMFNFWGYINERLYSGSNIGNRRRSANERGNRAASNRRLNLPLLLRLRHLGRVLEIQRQQSDPGGSGRWRSQDRNGDSKQVSVVKNTLAAGAISAALALTPPLIEKIEGIEYEVYYDIAGIPTVCAGITGKDVIIGKKYTKRECDALLFKHIAIAKKAVDGAVKVPIPDTMRAAMYSFTYNAGQGAFRKSTMLKDINAGNLAKACSRLYDWVYFYNPKTKKMERSRGLYNRRAIEYSYCMKEIKK